MSSNDSSLADSMLQTNNLNYGMKGMASITTQRSTMTVFPNSVTASQSGNIVFTSSSGDFFVNGRGSYLSIKLTTIGGNALTMLPSVHSLFSGVVVSHSSGVELCRVQDFQMYAMKKRYQQTHDQRALVTETEGIYKVLSAGAGVYYFIMRLDAIPFFDQHQLLPPHVMSSLRISFAVSNVDNCFKSAVAVSSFTLETQLKLDCVRLSDQFRRRVDSLSAETGLVLQHLEPHHVAVNSTSNSLNFPITKSASKATELFLFSRLSANINAPLVNSSSTEPYPWTSLQLNIGSQFLPISPLLQNGAPGVNVSAEPFHYTLLNATQGNYNSSVHYDHFYQAKSATTGSESGFCQNLREGASGDDMGGVLLNNSRALLVNSNLNGSQNRLTTGYLEHVRIVRVFLNACVVRD